MIGLSGDSRLELLELPLVVLIRQLDPEIP
jgi:hypothetical protein